jgi:uncharacterized protein (TIGR02300 family)
MARSYSRVESPRRYWVAKPEWGLKRTCQSCGARFYDLARSPITCPKCGSVVEPEVAFKPRRQSPALVEPKPEPILVEDAALEIEVDDAAGEELEVPEEEEEGDIAAIESDEEDENDLIEDASDLGEDDDDMAEVMEHIDEDLENEL